MAAVITNFLAEEAGADSYLWFNLNGSGFHVYYG